MQKIIQNPKNHRKFYHNQKPLTKPSKPINFHIPVIKTLIDPIQSETSGACRGFVAIPDQWRCIIAAKIEEKQEPK